MTALVIYVMYLYNDAVNINVSRSLHAHCYTGPAILGHADTHVPSLSFFVFDATLAISETCVLLNNL